MIAWLPVLGTMSSRIGVPVDCPTGPGVPAVAKTTGRWVRGSMSPGLAVARSVRVGSASAALNCLRMSAPLGVLVLVSAGGAADAASPPSPNRARICAPVRSLLLLSSGILAAVLWLLFRCSALRWLRWRQGHLRI